MHPILLQILLLVDRRDGAPRKECVSERRSTRYKVNQVEKQIYASKKTF